MKKLILASILTAASFSSVATIVEMQTSQGTIEINLFDQQTPKTVENFLSYVDDAAYNQTVIHRSVDKFVIQGGGFTFSDEMDPITTKPAVINEPVYSNVKGTIAMAKQGGNENSATSQWFFNMSDNSQNLDLQNGGFTVFGQVTAQSQETLDKIAALVHCSQVPLVGVTKEQCSDENLIISNENLVSIQSVVVLDDDPNSAQNLTPKENTLIDNVEVTPPKTSDSSGSMAWLLGALLLVAPRLKRAK
ncbi:peptidylprolyl isomerase [Pseudoalteromonas sp. SIMBA_153]|jgi:cyclophilin family peptidyl-prolyl cis-trans isomerase|uniref:peptidylprolyl isomerase n=1 Tax=Pseudoalteromonas TaxID=53246 RepID=UPI0006BB0D00|nr:MULTISPECIES: peptidylprolyl isomerase [Pseudoalteromonas]KPH91382.1 peptidylprolyl isomerase [Pseudoalteromonas undina]MBL0689156.1 peptidylprolyl isomerase [Pseudoalteromonas sp.]OLF75107.1 peptidylprolyl isomerase [Pseudoalteromonas haloplanktis]TMP58634.1 peptidylprolyl isomerase [Pseudoalteromonas sp. S1612]